MPGLWLLCHSSPAGVGHGRTHGVFAEPRKRGLAHAIKSNISYGALPYTSVWKTVYFAILEGSTRYTSLFIAAVRRWDRWAALDLIG